MPKDKSISTPLQPRRRILWLVVAHIVVGLVGAVVAYRAGPSPTLKGAVFFGLVFSQTSLLGIWGGLGTNPWWQRLIGIVVAVGYLVPLLGIGIHEPNLATLIVVTAATAFVLTVLLIARFFKVVLQIDASSVTSGGRIQFSIRHLMILTSVVACLLTIGKWLQPFFYYDTILFAMLLLGGIFGVVGVVPVWSVLATKRPVLYSLGVVALGVSAGYCYAWTRTSGQEGVWMTATATEVTALVLSLFVVRSCGYRLLRLPR